MPEINKNVQLKQIINSQIQKCLKNMEYPKDQQGIL